MYEVQLGTSALERHEMKAKKDSEKKHFLNLRLLSTLKAPMAVTADEAAPKQSRRGKNTYSYIEVD
jgi:hypothetical protein